MNLLAPQDIIKTLSKKGYAYFDNDTKPYNLNIFGIRTEDTTVNKFNDWLGYTWKYNGLWSLMMFQATTDPGLYWLQNPMNVKGTAILKPGQYRGMWEVGLHQGKYEALKQVGKCTVIRDFDRDGELDFDSGKEETGLFGINMHHASYTAKSENVEKWSAGCCVHAEINQYNIAISIAKIASSSCCITYLRPSISCASINCLGLPPGCSLIR